MIEIMPELFAAELVRDYLASEGSIAAGVPAEVVLPKFVMDEVEVNELPRPSLVIAAKEDKDSGGGRQVISITPIIATWQKASGADAPPNDQQTTRVQASLWQRVIDNRMKDLAAFQAWLDTLPEERLTGWAWLDTPRYGGAAVPLRNADTREVSYATTVTFYLTFGAGQI